MNKIKFLIITIIISFSVTIYLFINTPEFRMGKRPVWKYKEKEIINRLLAIPILLYHNIDGKGVFSIELDVLRSHFQLFKDRKIRVISLSELIKKLDNPAAFKKKAVVLTFDDGYNSMYTKLLPLAKEFGYPVTLFVYTDFIQTKGKKIMTWEKLRRLDKEGIDVQAHSMSHRDLTGLSKDNDKNRIFYEELYLAKRITEMYLNKEIKFFAFPYGRYDLKLIDLSQKAGFKRVFSTNFGPNIITRNNYCLRRHHIKKDYTLEYIEGLVK